MFIFLLSIFCSILALSRGIGEGDFAVPFGGIDYEHAKYASDGLRLREEVRNFNQIVAKINSALDDLSEMEETIDFARDAVQNPNWRDLDLDAWKCGEEGEEDEENEEDLLPRQVSLLSTGPDNKSHPVSTDWPSHFRHLPKVNVVSCRDWKQLASALAGWVDYVLDLGGASRAIEANVNVLMRKIKNGSSLFLMRRKLSNELAQATGNLEARITRAFAYQSHFQLKYPLDNVPNEEEVPLLHAKPLVKDKECNQYTLPKLMKEVLFVNELIADRKFAGLSYAAVYCANLAECRCNMERRKKTTLL